MRKFLLTGLLLMFYFIFCGQSALKACNVCEMVGIGGRSLGMGGVDIGIADDTSAMVSNPAGITQIENSRFDFGHGLFFPWVRFKNQDNPFRNSSWSYYHDPAFFYLPQWGFVKNLSGIPLSLGVGIFAVGGGGSRFQLTNEYFPEGKRVASELGITKFTPTIAYQITPKLSLGFALNIYYCPLEFEGMVGPVYIQVQESHAWGGGYAVGLLYKPTPKLRMGISYTSESMLEDFETDYGYVQIAGNERQRQKNTKIKDFQLPQKVGIGISYQFTPEFLVGFDAEWQNYSQSFNKFVIETEDFGDPTLPLKWKDSYMFAIGAEYKITTRIALRTGYCYTSESVTPDAGAFPYIPSTTADSHNLTAGFGYTWKDFLIDVGYSHQLDKEDKTKESRIGGDYDNSSLGFGDNLCTITFTWLYN